jgi:hypothetical protein
MARRRTPRGRSSRRRRRSWRYLPRSLRAPWRGCGCGCRCRGCSCRGCSSSSPILLRQVCVWVLPLPALLLICLLRPSSAFDGPQPDTSTVPASSGCRPLLAQRLAHCTTLIDACAGDVNKPRACAIKDRQNRDAETRSQRGAGCRPDSGGQQGNRPWVCLNTSGSVR